ncbi:MAG: TlpA family protein disulfide reductase [Gammaproteobacteria bacterium]|nr:TlpA family protein disulfide reductase [Gammaproteobacteria bacterium]MBL6998553.1 TlpA family protein disulfide reductase [Gammaproteobacteria bacterium]
MRLLKIICLAGALLFSQLSLAAVTQAPLIKLPALQGEFDLAKLQGKVVYLDFWASWCIPCRQSFPWMNEMQARYQDKGLEVVAVNLDKNRALADEFLQKLEAHFTIAFDADGESAKAYNLRGMPSSYLIGRDGKLYASHIGFREKDKAKMEQAIQQLLNQ